MKPDSARISAKDLGALALAQFCPRCFWIKRRAPLGLPYQIFPGIFSSIDSYSKRVVHRYFDRHGRPPPWLEPLGDIRCYVEPPHHSKFQWLDEDTGILLTGSPDGVLVRADGGHVIIDYKTSRFTGAADRLFPMYQVQLNAYALIGEANGFSPVQALALVYTEPVTGDEAASAADNERPDGFAMSFSARILPVEMDPARVSKLLKKARHILAADRAPRGRAGCRDCMRLGGLLEVAYRGDG